MPLNRIVLSYELLPLRNTRLTLLVSLKCVLEYFGVVGAMGVSQAIVEASRVLKTGI